MAADSASANSPVTLYSRRLMDVVVALHGVAAVLLVAAGVAKLARPQPAASVLGVLSLSASAGERGLGVGSGLMAGWARLLGSAEIVVGVAAIAMGGDVSAAVGVFYLGFALVMMRALALGAESCGCFGYADTPPSRMHVLGNLCCAAVSLAASGAGKSTVGMIADVGSAQPAGAIALVLAASVLAGLALAAFTALPEALQARSIRKPSADVFRVEPGSLRHFSVPLEPALLEEASRPV